MAQAGIAINKNIKFSYSDYLLYPSNGNQLQLIRGEFYMSPAPKTFHQIILLNMFRILDRFVRTHKLGMVLVAPVDVKFSEKDVVQPDILFIARQNLHIIARNYVQRSPDLVIEILSDKTKKIDLKLKRRLYAKYGVFEYWIVDPDRKTVEVLVLSESGYNTFKKYNRTGSLQSKVLPGLKLSVADIFKK